MLGNYLIPSGVALHWGLGRKSQASQLSLMIRRECFLDIL